MHVFYHFSLNFINIIILVYLMVDAPKHGKNQILWGILGLLLGPIALTIYLFQVGSKTWAYVWMVISILYVLAPIAFILIFVHMISRMF